ncbi:MAG: MBG domain-containing protein [Coriobacteriia bacterium]|nr:MBG domain-containing protein [Coriobacteriia bacterium]
MTRKTKTRISNFNKAVGAIFLSFVLVFSQIPFSFGNDSAATGESAGDSSLIISSGTSTEEPESVAVTPTGLEDEVTPAEEPAAVVDPAPAENPAPAEDATPAEEPAQPEAPAPTEVTVNYQIATGARVLVGQEEYATNGEFKAPISQELKFKVETNEGYEVDKVVANTTELTADANKDYALTAEATAADVVLVVTVKEVAPEPATNTNTNAAENTNATENASENTADNTNAVENTNANENASEKEQAPASAPAYEGYATVGGFFGIGAVTVKVTADAGVLPEGTTVQASKVNNDKVKKAIEKASSRSVKSYVAIDVTLADAQGKTIQPNGTVNVCFFNNGVSGEEMSVYYVNGDSAYRMGARQVDSGCASFDTNHFSTYAVSGLTAASTQAAAPATQAATPAAQASSAVGDYVTYSWADPKTDTYYAKIVVTVDGQEVAMETVSAKRNRMTFALTDAASSKYEISSITSAKGTDSSGRYKVESKESNSPTTITVALTTKAAPVQPTAISITGANTVQQYSTIQLTPVFTPEGSTTEVAWTSSNTDIATVDATGKVTGVATGKVTIYAGIKLADDTQDYATHTVEVTAPSSTNNADFYYLKTPLSDPASNDTSQWGSCIGVGTVNLTGAVFVNNKNCFIAGDPDRVITWPSGFDDGYVPKTSSHWTIIYNAFKSTVGDVAEDDIEYIRLVPYKISNNQTYHVDCTVYIKVANIYTATYYLWDAGGTGYVWQYAETVRSGGTTNLPSNLSNLPGTKTDSTGHTYRLVSWYENPGLSGSRASFPYSVTSNVNFYAKYVADLVLTYDLDGGTWDQTTDKDFWAAGTTAYVRPAVPTKDGYEFVGWKSSYDDEIYTGNQFFTMPDENVTLTALWKEKPKVLVTTTGGTWTYDGQAHGATVAVAGLPDGYTCTATSDDTATHVAEGTVTANCDHLVIKDADGNEVELSKFVITYEDGSITITPATLTVTTPDATKAYDGTPLTAEGSISGFVSGESAEFTVTGTQTQVGSSTNSYKIDWTKTAAAGDKQAAQSDYAITESLGTLTVNKNTTAIVITAGSATKPYDGTALTENAATVTYGGTTVTGTQNVDGTWSYTLPTNDKLTVTVTGTITDAGTVSNEVTYSLENASRYTSVTKKDGTLTITPVAIEITAASGSKTYDGTPLTNSGWTITSGKLVGNDAISVTVTGSQTYVGSSANVPSDAKMTTGDAKNYTFTYVNGTLTINKVTTAIVITAKSNSKIYDGTALTDSGYTYTQGVLAEGDVLTAVVEGSRTDAGSGDNTVTSYKVMRGDTDVTANYTFGDSVDGTLTVNPVEITITAEDATKVYDGTPLTKDSWKITSGALVGNDSITVKVTGSVTTVADSPKDNVPSDATVTAGKQVNYKFTYVNGKLTVTQDQNAIVINAASNSKTYDGTPLTANSATVTYGDQTLIGTQNADGNWEYTLPTGDKLTVTVTGSATNVSDTETGNNVVTYTLTNKEQYSSVTANNGTLTINPRTVTVTGDGWDDPQPYTGSQYSKNTCTFDNVVTGQTATITYDISGTNPGTYTGTFGNDFKVMAGDVNVTANYTLGTKTPGTLTINDSGDIKDYVILTPTDVIKTYDGNTYSAGTATANDSNGNTVKIEYSVDGDTWTTNPADIKATNVADSVTVQVRASVPGYYTGYVTGTQVLTINKRPVTFTGETASKTYTGSEQEINDVTVGGDGLVTDQTSNVVYSAKGTEVGNYPGDITTKDEVKITDTQGNDVTANYNITTTPGALTITASDADWTISLDDDTYTYDGADHYNTKSATSTALSGTTTFSYSFTQDGTYVASLSQLTRTDADTYTIYVKATNPNYSNEATTTAQLIINKALVTITTPTDSKTYDGTALTKEGTITGIVPSETVTFTTTGTQTYVGSSDNTYTLVWDGTAKESNYTVTDTVGKLTVTAPTSPDDDNWPIKKTHEGTEYALGETVTFTITVTNIYDETKTITITEQEGVTLSQNVFENVPSGETVNTTATYVVTQEDIVAGTFKNTATATFSGESTSYDGEDEITPEDPNPNYTVVKALTNAGTGTDGAFLADEVAQFTITVTNTGNLDLTNVTIAENLNGAVIADGTGYTVANNVATIATLPQGGTPVVINATYQVTQADVDAAANGQALTNVVTADATTPGGDKPDPNPNPVPVPTDKTAGLKVTKTSDADGTTVALGQTVTFTIVAENTGQVTLTNVNVVDQQTGLNETVASMAPGAKQTYTTTHVIDQADIVAGQYVNYVTAKGTDPSGNEITGETFDKVTPAAPNADFTAVKTLTNAGTGTDGAFKAGETAEFDITVKNVGNLDLTNVTVTENLAGATIVDGTGYTVTDNVATIESLPVGGEAVVVKATYTVTQADVDAAATDPANALTNVATVTGSGPGDNNPDPETPDIPVPTDKTGALQVVKTSDVAADATAALGQTVTYTITVTNNGQVTLSNIAVVDAQTGLSETIATLEPGATQTFTATHVIAEADVLAGTYRNTATATGTDPSGETVTGYDTETVTTDTAAGHITVTKATTSTAAAADGKYALGETISYNVSATNDGNVTLTNVVVTDPLTGATWTVGTLEPGQSTEVFATTYVVTEADVVAGHVVNNATATATTPDNVPDPETTPGTTDDPTVDPTGELTIVKTTTSTPAQGNTYGLGEVITYSITATNTGNITLNDVVVTDELTGDSWTVGTMIPGATVSYTATHTVTEADVLAENVVNNATGSATTPEGEPDPEIIPGETDDPTDDPAGQITVVKTTTSTPANGETYALGETITYQVVATNTGNVTLTDVVVTDELTGDTWNIDGEFAPAATQTFTATHVVTEADVLAGSVVNNATATGNTPDGVNPPEVIPGETEDPTDEPNGHATIVKTTTSTAAAADGRYVLGEAITYNVTVTNDGNLTLTDVVVTDELTGDEWTVDSLAPGASRTFTATHVVTEADILAGTVVNNATGTATSPDPDNPNPPVVPGTTTDDPEDPAGHATITKTTTSTPADGKAYVLGETITYNVTVTNDGNLTLTDVVVTDELTGDEWTVDSLAPGASRTFTATHVVTEADILAGTVVNNATGTATSPDPDNPNPPVVPGTTEDDPENPNGHITVTKTSDVAEGTLLAEGDVVNYTVTATNDGNLTLTDVVVNDELLGASWTIEGEFAPGASQTFTGSYTVTAADVAAGHVANVATATGTSPDPDNPTPPVTPGETDDPTEVAGPSLFVDKVADVKSGATLGQTVTFTITVTNNGNVTVTGITVADEQTGLSETIDSLAAGETRTFTTTHVITEADILAGGYANTATATGEDPNGNPVEATDTETVTPENPAGHITVAKTSSASGTVALGDTVNYSITATNDGNLTLTNVVVTDELTGDEWTIESFAPGASQTFTTTYTVTEADVLAGHVVNVATATGTSPDPDNPNPPVTPGETDDPAETPVAHMTIVKTSDVAEGTLLAEGDVVNYTVTATNDGNLTLTDVVVTDELTGDSWTVDSLAPGASQTFTATYTVTAADVAAGQVVNVATATADPIDDPTDPGNPIIPGTTPGETDDPTEVAGPSLFVEKTSDATAAATVGQTVTFTITVTNNGNVVVNNIAVTDELTGLSETIQTLAPGASQSFTTTHVITEADAIAGSYVNVATATGTTPDGTTVTDDGTSTVPTTPAVVPGPGPAPVVPAGPGFVPAATPIDGLIDAMETLAETVFPPAETTIDEDGNPLAGPGHDACWVHYYIFLGILVTLAYSLCVIIRRQNYIRRLNNHDDDAMGKNKKEGQQGSEGVGSPAGAQPVM